jgi:circadian clock protein KaiC
MTPKPRLELLPTGVPGLDEVLGGGLPKYSFNLIAGAPGTGKTTLAQQIMFANATTEQRGLFFTVLGEPPVKMLRYQQQFSFFDVARLDREVRLVNLNREALAHDAEAVLGRIVQEVEACSPGIVVVDSFRTVARIAQNGDPGAPGLQALVHRLALHLTGWQATTFLVGEYEESELHDNPVLTVADGIVRLWQSVDRNSAVRKLQVVKSRGVCTIPGLHTARISADGLRVFPRITTLPAAPDRAEPCGRLSTGVAALDEMMDGGIPAGDSVLVAGPSGAGKSVLAAQFIASGAAAGEPGVLVVFEEHPKEYVRRAMQLGIDLAARVEEGVLEVIYLRPLDLSPDETLFEIGEAVRRLRAKRVVIDSMSGFELALAPTFRGEFRESLYRLIGALTGAGITVLTTVETMQAGADLRFTPNAVSFLADDIVLLRYVETEGRLGRVLLVAKMRGSQHAKELRSFEILPGGLVLEAAPAGDADRRP